MRYKNRYGRQRAYHTTFEGRGHQRRAPSPRDRVGIPAGQARAVHARDPVPLVQGHAAASGIARRHRGRSQHRGADRPVHPRRARVRGRRRAVRTRADDRGAAAEGDPRAAAVPGGRRPRLPDPRARGGNARRRRGAADPPRHPDRQRSRGRALHPGRALHRAAPARQPASHRHARPAPRPRQHADRRRARRGHHPGGGPHRGHRAAGGRARRGDRLQREAQGAAGGGAVAHGCATSAAAVASRRPRPGARPASAGSGCEACREHNLKDIDVDIPLGLDGVRDGRQRLGQVHPGAGRAAPCADAEGLPVAGAAGQAQEDRRLGADRQGHRHRPVAHRAHAALQPGHLHGRVRPRPQAVRAGARTPGCAGSSPAGSASTSAAAAASSARATDRSRSRCTSCPTST